MGGPCGTTGVHTIIYEALTVFLQDIGPTCRRFTITDSRSSYICTKHCDWVGMIAKLLATAFAFTSCICMHMCVLCCACNYAEARYMIVNCLLL